MAGTSYRLDDELAQDVLSRVERVAADPVAVHHAIGAHFVFSTRRNFETETAPDGEKWRPLSPRTASKRVGRSRQRRGYDHILRVTTRLYQSVSYEVLADGVEWGSNLAYAGIHQLGGVINMPARQGAVTLKNIRRKGNRFVRLGTRRAETRTVAIRGHQVRIPARPMVGISAYDRQEVPRIVEDVIRREAGL